jgi:hypothetical protein
MNAEQIRKIRKQITPELADLLRKIGNHPAPACLLVLLVAEDIEASFLIDGGYLERRRKGLGIPKWLEAGYKYKKSDIGPYVLAEALDPEEKA